MNLGSILTNIHLSLLVADLSPIVDLFKSKNINNVILFNCLATNREALILKIFQSQGIGCASFNVDSNISYKTSLAYTKVGLYLNTSCKTWENFFAFDVSKYKSRYPWVLYVEDLSKTIQTLSKYPLEIDSDVTIVTKWGNKYLLHEIYNTGFYTQGSFVSGNIGYWDKELYIDKNINRNNFRGLVMKCGVVLMEDVEDDMSRHYLTVTSRGKVDPLHRFKYFKLLSHLQDLFNFSCNLVRTKSWGYQRNASFDGLVGVLQRREADIGGAPVFYRAERAEVVDYTAQIWPSKPYIILRQPKYSGSFFSVYTRPLTPTVWWCIIAVLAVTVALLATLLKVECLNAAGDEADTSPSLAALFVVGAVSQQGMPVKKRSITVKIVIFVTFIFTLTLYQYYNATVVSTLLRVPAKVIDSLVDLVKSDLKAGVDDALYNRDFFKRTTDPLALELHSKKIVTGSRSNYFTPEHGMGLVKRGGFAFLVDTATAYRIMRRTFSEPEVCDATELSLYPPQSMGSVAVKGTPYKEFLARGTSMMLESGVMSRLKAMWDEPRPPCVRTPDSSVFSINIYEFSTALFVLLLGALAAAVVLLAEMVTQRLVTKLGGVRGTKLSSRTFPSTRRSR